jgi:Skp family chaperone for outer membrane proteins
MLPAMMNRLPLAALAFAATVLSATASPRFAVVRVKEIYAGLQSTAELQEEIKRERGEIMQDARAGELRKIIAELQDLQAKLSDKNNPPAEEVGRKLARTYELKRQEAQTLQKDFEGFRAEREKEINRKMVTRMRASLDRIMETSRRIGKEQGFDVVLDGSGNTNTGVAFVLYQKDSPDLTDHVKAALKDEAGTAAPQAAKPTPSH